MPANNPMTSDRARAEVDVLRERRRMATRMVTGGRARSARPPVTMGDLSLDPGGCRGSNTRRREFPPRPLPRSKKGAFVRPVVSRFARGNRLPCVTPSGVENGVAGIPRCVTGRESTCDTYVNPITVTPPRIRAIPASPRSSRPASTPRPRSSRSIRSRVRT